MSLDGSMEAIMVSAASSFGEITPPSGASYPHSRSFPTSGSSFRFKLALPEVELMEKVDS